MDSQTNPRTKTNDAPAIFTRFVLPPPAVADAPYPSATEKLRAILAKLDAQHDAVRRNLIFLVGVEKDRIVQEAVAKRRLQEENGELQYEGIGGLVSEKELSDLLERLRAPATEGSDGSEYLFEAGDFPVPGPSLPQQGEDLQPAGEVLDRDGDAAMGKLKRGLARSGSSVGEDRTRMSTNLQALFVWAAARIKTYDVHAANTRKKYEDALERHLMRERGETPTSGSGNTSAAGSRRGSGILINRNEPVRVNMEAMARIEDRDEGSGMMVTIGPWMPVVESDMGRGSRRGSSLSATTGNGSDAPKGPRKKASVTFAI